MPLAMPITLALEAICDRLSERTATLFLGAGINAGVIDNNGLRFPLGQDLRDWIAKDLLSTPGLSATLEDVAEMARHRLDERYVNDYIYKKFTRFRPSTAHLALVQLPWDVIYSTNYDLLVEEASVSPTVEAAGMIRPVVSVDTDLTQFSEYDILYYKLHGSVEVANSQGGRLILTRDDYRFYDLHRKPLFRRLADDLARRTFVFVGYSLTDDDFRAIIEDCRNELGGRALPLSYAVRHSFTRVEEAFWRDKYNIQLVKADSDEFLNSLKDMWLSGNNSVISLSERRAKQYVEVDPTAHFRKLAESFFEINHNDCTGLSNPVMFFNGNEPTWADIRDRVPPERDVYWNLFDALFQELQDPSLPPSLYLISGAAGTGKTTLLHAIGYDIAKSFDLRVLEHIPGTPFEARFIGPLMNADKPSRIVVLLRHAGENMAALERFMEDAKQKKLPLTVIVEERSNQWIMANELVRNRLAPTEFELGALSSGEISGILDALTKHNALGKLTGTARSYQEEHFTSLAHKELLVALRELTTGRNFDEIIRDEYGKIPSEVAKEVYKYVAALGQIDVPIRYPVLLRLADIGADQLSNLVFKPAQGILISRACFQITTT